MSTKYRLAQSEAINKQRACGGWVIRYGDLDWRWTDDRAVAVDLVLPLTRGDRTKAEWMVAQMSVIWCGPHGNLINGGLIN